MKHFESPQFDTEKKRRILAYTRLAVLSLEEPLTSEELDEQRSHFKELGMSHEEIIELGKKELLG